MLSNMYVWIQLVMGIAHMNAILQQPFVQCSPQKEQRHVHPECWPDSLLKTYLGGMLIMEILVEHKT